MEEFQEAEILWPAAGSDDDDRGNNSQDNDVVFVADGGEAAPTPCSVRPKPAAPIEISRRKRRCRPWPASESEHYNTENEVGDDAHADAVDAERTTSAGLAIVPPHVLAARRRLAVRGRTAAYSMCAGKGRTLKGRDLREVRNHVLKMTGFIEE